MKLSGKDRALLISHKLHRGLYRQALCELFKREADFEVCGEAENGKEAVEKAQELRPDLIVLARPCPRAADRPTRAGDRESTPPA
jgi:chemotaxis response regulator CheB